MLYYGAEDYYFWQGARWGQERSSQPVLDVLDEEMPKGMVLGKKCRNAAMWGFFCGICWTLKEYSDMMVVVEKKPDKPVKRLTGTVKSNNVRIDKLKELLDHKYPFKGNC